MALTRKALKAMGCTDEQVDTIAEEHGERVKALQDKIDELTAKYADYDEIVKERDELKAGEDWKARYEKEHTDFEGYKKSISEKDERAAKETAAKAYFEKNGITGANLVIAMRGAKADIDSLKVKDGKIADSSALDELIKGDYAVLITTQETRGATMATPPQTGGKTMTKAEIFSIKDTAERQKAIAANPQLFPQ